MTQAEILTSYLRGNKYPTTAEELYEAMDAADRGEFKGGVRAVTDALLKMRDRKGIVENGEDRDTGYKGRNLKTWKLTPEAEVAATVSRPEVSETSEVSLPEEAVAEFPAPTVGFREIIAPPPPSELQWCIDLPATSQAIVIHKNEVEGCLLPVYEAIMRLKIKSKPTVRNLATAISTLEFVTPMLNSSYREVLEALVEDLKAMEAA